MASKIRPGTSGDPELEFYRKLTPEERVNMAVEMSSVAGELVIDSIQNHNPGLSEARLIEEARRRTYQGRSPH